MREIRHSPIYPDTTSIDRDWLPIVVLLAAAFGLGGALLHLAWSLAA